MERLTAHASKINPAHYPGAVLCRDLSLQIDGKRRSLRRGAALEDVIEQITNEAGDPEIHFLVPHERDIDQETASLRIAGRIAGRNLEPAEPHQGQVDLRADTFGVLRIQPDSVSTLNASRLALVATALDGRVVEAGETVAIVKAPELLISEPDVNALLDALPDGAVIEVVPFIRSNVALIAGDRIREANLNVSAKHLGASLERFGARLTDIRKIPDDPDGIARVYQELLDAGTELILVAGSIVLDPEDPFLVALERVDAELVRRGAPIDPGTMFWVAQRDGTPFFGLASCEMYGKLSIIDLFLPYALAGQSIDNELISRLGYGGLLNDTHAVRRPATWRE